jgi:hypothetical protein
METTTLIFLLVVLFLIYCFQHRNQISQMIESFTQTNPPTSYGNLLPPIDNASFINVPYKEVVGGTMVLQNPSGTKYLEHHSTSSNSYTNHFMFTPLDKTKEIYNDSQGDQRNDKLRQKTYVLSVQCKNDPSINSGNTDDIEVEIWIFGLNKGRRHYVDQSYQDFKSIIKSIPSSETDWTTIELKYQPLNINTEYVAVRFDNNSSGKKIFWKNPQLEVYNDDSRVVRRENCNFATQHNEGAQLYKKASSDGSEAGFVLANALTVNKFCNYDNANSIAAFDDISNYNVSKNLEFSTPSSSINHYANKRINSYFPTLDAHDDISSNKHFEQYFKIKLKFVFRDTRARDPTITMTNIKDFFKYIIKTFTNVKSESYTDQDKYYNENLFGFLKKQYYNNEDRLNITDINIANDVIQGGNPEQSWSDLRVGQFRFKCNEDDTWGGGSLNTITNFIHTPQSTIGDSFSIVLSTQVQRNQRNIIEVPLNIYYNSPRTIDLDETLFKNDVRHFMRHKLTNITISSIPNINIRTFGGSENQIILDSNNDELNNIVRVITPRTRTPKRTVSNCTTYEPDRSQCTAMATEVSGIGSQIQECSCTRCSDDNNVLNGVINNILAASGSNTDNISLLPGHGNPFYFCERQKNINCGAGRLQGTAGATECNQTDGCVSRSNRCIPTCVFDFPPNYNPSPVPQNQNYNVNMSEPIDPYTNDFQYHYKILSQNSCQIYHDNNSLYQSKVNMNHFRNFFIRLDSNGRPLDLSFNMSPYLSDPEVGITPPKLYLSKYRGKEFIIYRNTGTTPPDILLYHYNSSGSSNSVSFLNISLDSVNSFNNLNNENNFVNDITPIDMSFYTQIRDDSSGGGNPMFPNLFVSTSGNMLDGELHTNVGGNNVSTLEINDIF